MALTEEQVVAYLAEHSDFFIHCPKLLETLSISQDSSTESTSLLERQVILLRKKNRHIADQFRELAKIAAHNESTTKKMCLLILALLEKSTCREIFDTLYLGLTQSFSSDWTLLRLFCAGSDEPEFAGENDAGRSLFQNVLHSKIPYVGILEKEQHDYLSQTSKHVINSAAIVPLGKEDWEGILIVGSHDKGRFSSGMRVELLSYLGAFLSCLVHEKLLPSSANKNDDR